MAPKSNLADPESRRRNPGWLFFSLAVAGAAVAGGVWLLSAPPAPAPESTTADLRPSPKPETAPDIVGPRTAGAERRAPDRGLAGRPGRAPAGLPDGGGQTALLLTTPDEAEGADAGAQVDDAARRLTEGDVKGAIRELQLAVQAVPDDPRVHRLLGIAFEQAGDEERAMAAYEDYLFLEPAAPDAAPVRASIARMQSSPRRR